MCLIVDMILKLSSYRSHYYDRIYQIDRRLEKEIETEKETEKETEEEEARGNCRGTSARHKQSNCVTMRHCEIVKWPGSIRTIINSALCSAWANNF